MGAKISVSFEVGLDDLKIALDELKEQDLLVLVKNLVKDMEAESLDELERYIESLPG